MNILNDLRSVMNTETRILWATLLSAGVAAVVSASTTYLLERFKTRDNLTAEYEHEQRKKLRELIGRYHGRFLQASVSLNHRLWNLYANCDKGWHDLEYLTVRGHSCDLSMGSPGHRQQAVRQVPCTALPTAMADLSYWAATMFWFLRMASAGPPSSSCRKCCTLMPSHTATIDSSSWAARD